MNHWAVQKQQENLIPLMFSIAVRNMLVPQTFWRFCPKMHTSMHQAGKRSGQQLEATSIAGHTQSCLLNIIDRTSGLKFLVDTGVEVSVVPHLHTHRKTQSKGSSLQAINNTIIPTYSICLLTLNLRLCRTFGWVFIITDISRAMIGADFLKHYGLSVDMKSHHLLDPLMQLKVQGITSSVTSSLALPSNYESIQRVHPNNARCTCNPPYWK